MENIWRMYTSIFHILFNAVSIFLAGCKRVCKTGDGKKIFYPLLLVFGLLTVVSQPLYASDTLHGVTYGNSTFVAVGDEGIILTSPDGVTWTTRTSGTSEWLGGVTYGNATFVAVGSDGTIITSPDGVTWTTSTSASGTSKHLYGVTYGNSTFIAVGSLDDEDDAISFRATGLVLTSPDGVTWTTRKLRKSHDIYSVTYGNSTFVAIGEFYTNYGENGKLKNIIFTSKNGIKWRTSKPPKKLKQFFDEITYGNSTFVAVGEGGIILTSPDVKTWTKRTSGTSEELYGVTYGNSTFFVAVGEEGTILTSPDGVTWTKRTSGTSNRLSGVTYGNSTFVAVGRSGTILTSPDGVTWSER